ncbi:hypothetical protein RIR_jg39319.t1 [Rhizophagus irregularis DAOM 181602=DAOM 197198]|nr:hypothetical protein RIR_jg39319.t1 [Rhizophagus irregularis DAOM 181602=DAOM 197198]
MWILPDAVGIWKTVQSDSNINFLSTPAPLKTQCNRRITSKYSKLGCACVPAVFLQEQGNGLLLKITRYIA